MAERPKVCIDRVLPRNTMRHMLTMRGSGNRVRALNPLGTKWMNGSTLHVRFMGGTAEERKVARDQAAWWSAVANLNFVFDDAPNAEIRISFDHDDGAWSYIGTESRDIPLNDATMNLGFLDGGTAGHEFGHAIGLAHEHQNPAIGFQWKEEIVIREMAKSPNFWSAEETRNNILFRYAVDQINGTAFDPESIMLYFFPGSWTTNGVGTEQNEVLSGMDKAFIGCAKMYPKGGGTPAQAKDLAVNAKRRTQASIGKFGEEDLFRFQIATDGRYVVDTRGPTDVVMKLFGPNSETAVIAEDDDSGVDSNARIGADLLKGDYWVQVRHYNRASGKGNYSVKVARL